MISVHPRRHWWVLALAIAVLALAASANSITNGFAYDDVYLIARAPRMHSIAGLWRELAHTYWPESQGGGEGYRPLTIMAFRLEWALGAGRPIVFHAVNIAVYVAGAVAVFWLACAALPLGAAWIAAALFAVHPVHVEAVANVVGQSELWVAFLLTCATALYAYGRRQGGLTRRRWLAIIALYAVALLFKEHAIVLPALLVLAELTIVPDRSPWRQRLAPLRVPLLLLVVVASAYMLVRSRVLVAGISGFRPYIVFSALRLSEENRILTMIGLTPEWLRLFLWPARLTTEYAPPYIDVAQGPSITQLPGLLMLVGVLGIIAAAWRRSPATSFALGWVVVTMALVSNLLVPAGFIIAERTLLLPSVGAMLAVGSAVPWAYARLEGRRAAQSALAVAVLVLVSLGVLRSYKANPVWHDNETLFRYQVQAAPESYRAHFMLGLYLFENERKAEGEAEYRRALRLFPYDPLMALGLAEQYRKAGMCEPAITMYRWLYTLEPESNEGHLGFATCLLITFKLDDARAQALEGVRGGASVRDARAIIAAARAAHDSLAVRQARGDVTTSVASQPR